MRFKILLLSLLLATTTFADSESIIIRQKSGNETVLELSTNPVITFEGEYMVITNSFANISFPIGDIDGYTVSPTPVGIEAASATPVFQNGHVLFTNLPKEAVVFVYTLDGKLVCRNHPDSTGKADINLDSLSKGAYAISTPNQTIKVINK